MINVAEESQKKPEAILIGEKDGDIFELQGLCETLGINAVRTVILSKREKNPVYGLGKGKAKEIAALCEELNVDAVIFDFLIEPRKQRNWEKLVGRAVFDRQEVIIRIFASRAQTKEARLQVQLARLEYSLPRLAHSYGVFSRQRGGAFGSKGSGETQLELDERAVREKIATVKKRLFEVEKTRKTQKKMRKRAGLFSVALSGYTNAGKSTLLNALTGAGAFSSDSLFATLDPLTRKLKIAPQKFVLLTDTVGFIQNLPHTLVNAFKSTLDEAAEADAILLVLDASDKNVFSQYETVERVLAEIGAKDSKKIVILNKIDKISNEDFIVRGLDARFPEAIKVSAKSGEGLDLILKKIECEFFTEDLYA
mgnify:CR=1 FL=1